MQSKDLFAFHDYDNNEVLIYMKNDFKENLNSAPEPIILEADDLIDVRDSIVELRKNNGRQFYDAHK